MSFPRFPLYAQASAVATGGFRDARQAEFPTPRTLLTRTDVTARLGRRASSLLSELLFFPGLDSTHAYLERLLRITDIHGVAVLAEQQWAGRGRHGRFWVSPFGHGIYLSIGWRESPTTPVALTIRAALWCLKALAELGLEGLSVKWPNDLVHTRGKIGGLLGTRLRASRRLVLGVGLNIHPLDGVARRRIGRSQSSLAECYPGLPERYCIAGALLGALLEGLASLRHVADRAQASLPAQFAPYDFLGGRTVEVSQPGGKSWRGVAAGVDTTGALLLRLPDGDQRRVSAGQVRLG